MKNLLFVLNIDDFLFQSLYGAMCFLVGMLVLAFFSNKAHDFLSNLRFILQESSIITKLTSEIEELKKVKTELQKENAYLKELNETMRASNEMMQLRLENYDESIQELRAHVADLQRKLGQP